MRRDGSTLREHLQALYRNTRQTPPELLPPPLPAAAGGLLDTWNTITKSRTGNGFGPSPLTWQDIHAWQSVSGMQLTPWEAETFLDLDRAVLAAQASPAKDNDNGN